MPVPTTTPSTGYRNNILHISYCAAGVSRQGRRPEVIPAVSSFFPLLLPLLFHLLFFSFSHFFFPLPFSSLTLSSHSFFFSHSFIPLLFLLSLFLPSPFFFSHSFIPLSFLSSLSYTPPIPPPRHSSILSSGLASFPAPTAPSPEKMFRTCRTFRPKCHRSRYNPTD